MSTSLRVVPNFSQGIWSEQNTQVRAGENRHLRMSPSLRAKFFMLVCILYVGQTILVACERRRMSISGRDSSAFTSSMSEKNVGTTVSLLE